MKTLTKKVWRSYTFGRSCDLVVLKSAFNKKTEENREGHSLS